MNAEIGSGRLMAPYYGTSTTTWALLIGTILISLAGGSLVGGHFSRKGKPEHWLTVFVLAAALLLALLPRIAPWCMVGSLTRLRTNQIGALAGSACAVAVLISIPVLLLGAVSPLVLQAAGRHYPEGRLTPEFGQLAGRLYAAGTIGSLVGTFSAGLLFIPWLGTTRTIDIGALALALAGTGIALRMANQPTAIVAVGVTALLFVVSIARAAAMPESNPARVVWSGESRYNHIAVFERGDERQLRVNDGFAVQSLSFADGRLPLYDVWGYYALSPAWGTDPSPKRVLLLGLGGGTSAEIFRSLYPEARVTGVELDEEIVRAGKQYLRNKLDSVDVVIEDARTFIAKTNERWDVIVLDAFQFPYIPFQLTTQEFFEQVARCLSSGGVLMVNAGRYGEHRGVVHALSRTLRAIFPNVLAADARNPSNTLIIAFAHNPHDAVGMANLVIPAAKAREFARLTPSYAAMQPASWPDETPLLTDDHAPVEWLTDRIVWQEL